MGMEKKIKDVKIEMGKGEKVSIRIPYDRELIEKVKTLPGRKWNPEEKYWGVPYEENLLSKLKALFGEALVVGPKSGIDPGYIQELLGHKSSKTTEIYTHVSKASLAKIKNPLDSMMEGEI